MGKIGILLLSVAIMCVLSIAHILPASAEETSYSFASYRPTKQINVAPGGGGEGVILFYNIDGNRITHVTLKVTQPPEGIEVEIQPPVREVVSTINGISVTVSENLHVEPSAAMPEPPSEIPDGMVCVNIPERGHVLASPAYVVVRAPNSAQIGTTAEVTITAYAEWLGQTGAIVMKQERDFAFFITISPEPGEFSETIHEPGISHIRWWLLALASVGVILALFFTWRLIASRRRVKSNSN